MEPRLSKRIEPRGGQDHPKGSIRRVLSLSVLGGGNRCALGGGDFQGAGHRYGLGQRIDDYVGVGKKAYGDGATLCRYWRESSFLVYVSRLTWDLLVSGRDL